MIPCPLFQNTQPSNLLIQKFSRSFLEKLDYFSSPFLSIVIRTYEGEAYILLLNKDIITYFLVGGYFFRDPFLEGSEFLLNSTNGGLPKVLQFGLGQ